jgi:Lrp/AsnC family leucine-responsive transcriptional regulator
MDALDWKALALLAARGRLSWAELAEALGLSAPAAADRVKRLEEQGIVRGYEARVDPKAVGDGLTAFIAVNVARPRDRAELARRVAETPEILECHHVAGEDDYLLKVRCRGTEDLERLLTDGLKAHDGLVRTRTTVVLSTTKEITTPPSVTRAAAPRPRGKEKK